MMAPDRKLIGPLRSVPYILGGLILAFAAISAITAITAIAGVGAVGGFGRGPVCVTQPNTGYGGDNWTAHLGIATEPGASISINGTLQACGLPPSPYQRFLYTFPGLPPARVGA